MHKLRMNTQRADVSKLGNQSWVKTSHPARAELSVNQETNHAKPKGRRILAQSASEDVQSQNCQHYNGPRFSFPGSRYRYML